MMQRRQWLQAAASVGLAAFLPHRSALAQATAVEVWKDPNCGCCHLWVEHLQANGFKVAVRDVGNNAARKRLGMPEKLGSVALGLAVPGMPIGSPGMDGPEYKGRKDAFDVLLVQKDGSTKSFQRYSGQGRMA
jgi:hypothetical protein